MNNEFYNGKTILISGATGGIGKHVAQIYSKFDCNVIMVHKNDNLHSREFIKTISGQKARIYDFLFDLTNDTSLRKLSNMFIDKNLTFDIIINCVGVFFPSLVSNVDQKILVKTISNNLYAPINLIKTSLPFFNLSQDSRIVNISSVAADNANIGQGVYAMSKAALNVYTKCLAQEFFRYKIPVNLVSPGFVETSMSMAYHEKYINEIPFKRFAKPSEVAAAVEFLTSEKAKYITGQNIIVDGGFLSKNV